MEFSLGAFVGTILSDCIGKLAKLGTLHPIVHIVLKLPPVPVSIVQFHCRARDQLGEFQRSKQRERRPTDGLMAI